MRLQVHTISILFLASGQIYARNLIRFGGKRFAIPSVFPYCLMTWLQELEPVILWAKWALGWQHIIVYGMKAERFHWRFPCDRGLGEWLISCSVTSNWSIAKSMHVTPKVRRKGICYVEFMLKVFFAFRQLTHQLL